MGDAAVPRRQDELEIVITGFGPFAGVDDNPTSRLVAWLEGDGMDLPGGKLRVCRPKLRVSAKAVDAFFDEVEGRLKRAQDEKTNGLH